MNKVKIHVINGPNLNLLGEREPDIYGSLSLEDIINQTTEKMKGFDCEISWFQSNIEGEIIDLIQESSKAGVELVVINPGGYTHTSVAILDALKSCKAYRTEVHLTNTSSREEYRKTKITSSGVDAVIEGFGADVYHIAMLAYMNKGDIDDSNNTAKKRSQN